MSEQEAVVGQERSFVYPPKISDNSPVEIDLKIMEQSVTLNIPTNLSPDDWRKVAAVYKTLDGWIADPDCAYWYGREGDTRYIWASAEPGGLLFCGRVESSLWSGWLTVLCARLSLALGREVHDAEM